MLFATLFDLWQWLQTSEGAAAGVLASMIGLLVTLIGFGITLWRIRSWAKRQEQIVNQLAGKILEYQLKELQRLLRLTIDAVDTCKWEMAHQRCEEAQILSEQLLGNPSLQEDEKERLRDLANELHWVARYVMNRKIKVANPPESFDAKKMKVFREIIQLIAGILQRLEEVTWRHLQ